MSTYRYYTTDNRVAFSPVSLQYALTPAHVLDLKKLAETDMRSLSIIADNQIADIFTAASESQDLSSYSITAENLESEAWYLHNYCLMVGDKLHIRNGREYVSLSSFVNHANIHELRYVIHQLAKQAALCRAELLNARNDVVAG